MYYEKINLEQQNGSEPVFVNLLRSLRIDSQPGGIYSRAPKMFTNSGSDY
jgi:hypothetical protein